MDIKPIETLYKGYRFRSRLEARWAVFFDALGLKWEYEKEGFDLTNEYLEYLAGLETERMQDLEWNRQLTCGMKYQDLSLLTPEMRESLNNAVTYKTWTAFLDLGMSPPDEEEAVGIDDIWMLDEADWPIRHINEQPTIDTSLSLRYLPDFYLREQDWWVEIKPFKDEQPWMDDIRHELFPMPLIVLFGQPGSVSTEQYYRNPPYAGAVACDSPYYLCECPSCGALGFQFDGRSARNKHLPGCKAMTGDKGYNADSLRIIEAGRIAISARFEHGESPLVRSR